MKEHRPLQIFTGVCLAVFFLAAAVSFTLHFRPLYLHDLRAYDLPGRTGLTEQVILEQYDALIAYNSITGPGTLHFSALPSSETGLIHFAEVKAIFLAFQWAAIAALPLSAAGVWFLAKKRPRRRPRYLKYAAIISLALPTAAGLGVALAWDRFFVLFHQVFFRNDYWLFSAETDPIITLLPDGYFMHCAILIVGLVVLAGLACLALYLGLCRRQKRLQAAGAG